MQGTCVPCDVWRSSGVSAPSLLGFASWTEPSCSLWCTGDTVSSHWPIAKRRSTKPATSIPRKTHTQKDHRTSTKILSHRNHNFYYSINHRHCWTVALSFQLLDVDLARSLNWRGNIALDKYLPFCFFWFPKGADQSTIVTRNRGSILLLWMHTPSEP